MNERTNEWTSERTNQPANEPTSKRMNERASERMNERANEWTSERANERTRERTNAQTSERTNERASERANERMNEQTKERTSERTNERANERTNEWTSEQMNERASERTSEQTNEQTNERANERANERTNEITNERMNETMNSDWQVSGEAKILRLKSVAMTCETILLHPVQRQRTKLIRHVTYQMYSHFQKATQRWLMLSLTGWMQNCFALKIERFSFECRKVIGFVFTTLRDCFKKLAPLFHPIRSKTKTSRDSLVRVFPHFASATCNYFVFWLVHLILCVLCDWLEWWLWFCFYDTLVKTALSLEVTPPWNS